MTAPLLSTDVHSPSYIIREGLIDRLKLLPTFQTVKLWGRSRMWSPFQPEQLPLVCVYLMREEMSFDGDPMANEPHFIHQQRIGFSVVVQNNDRDAAEQNLDTATWTILRTLENQRWWNFPATGEWRKIYGVSNKKIYSPPIKIEAITKGQRDYNYGPRKGDNVTPYAECAMDLTITFRTFFPPGPFDDLNRIHVTVAYPWPYDPGAYEPPFTVEYDLTVEPTQQQEEESPP